MTNNRLNGVALITPIKAQKGKPKTLKLFDTAYEQLFNTAVSKVRQPIEALFSWFEKKTKIQQVCKVRSDKGLMVHVFGKLAECMFLADFIHP